MSLSDHHTSSCRTPSGPADDPERLRRLVRLVAVNDRSAFRELHARRSGAVARCLHSQVWDPYRAAGILAGTFVEVWWLAGAHVEPDTDVAVWIGTIVQRRVADSRPAALSAAVAASPRVGTVGAGWARFAELELADLLGHRMSSLI